MLIHKIICFHHSQISYSVKIILLLNNSRIPFAIKIFKEFQHNSLKPICNMLHGAENSLNSHYILLKWNSLPHCGYPPPLPSTPTGVLMHGIDYLRQKDCCDKN